MAGNVIVQNADAGAGTHRFRLAGGAGNLERRVPAAHDFAGEIERGGKNQVLDVTDAGMPFQVLDRLRCAVEIDIGSRGIEPERVICQL